MTRPACRPARGSRLIARDTDFTTRELHAMQRDFRLARARSDGASDSEIVLRILSAYITDREAA